MNSFSPNTALKSTIPGQDTGFNLSTYFSLVKRHWLAFSITMGSVFALSAVYALNIKPMYEARGLIMLNSRNQSSSLIPGIGNFSGAGQNALNTQMAILKTEPVLVPTIRELGLQSQNNQPLDPRAFLEQISVSPLPRTDIFQVSYRGPDESEAVQVVNSLMNNFVSNDIRLSRTQRKSTREFIESQLPITLSQLNQALQKRQEFSEKHNLLAIDAQVTALVTELAQLRQNISARQAELTGLIDTQVELESITGVNTREANGIAMLAESSGIQQAITTLQNTESEIAALSSRYQPEHPEIQALIRKRTSEEQIVNDRITQLIGSGKIGENNSPVNLQRGPSSIDFLRTQIRNAILIGNVEKQLESLQQRLNFGVTRSNELPEIQKQFLLLQLDVETARTQYTTLLQAFNSAQLAENQNEGGVVIVQEATPLGYPVSTSRTRVLILGAILGSILGLGIAYLLDQIDKTIYTEDEIKNIYSFSTVLASIPQLNSPERKLSLPIAVNDVVERHTTLVVRDEPRLPASEAYRMLLANIKFSNSDSKLRVITVTSAMPGEGKSTTVANLGLAISELGLRVIIVDSDMRRPSQHDVWQIPNRVGLSNYLVEAIPFDDCLYAENDFLDVVTAGVIPPNPVALLNSEKYENLLKRLSESYDYVLLDAPPLTVSADALMLGKNSNAILLVARPGKLIRPAAIKAKESIQQSGQNLLGLVVNGVNSKSDDDLYYYYGQEKEPEKQSLLSLLIKR